MEKRFIYADNAATTKVSKPVLDAMMPYFTEEYGNASSIYALGRSAKKLLKLQEKPLLRQSVRKQMKFTLQAAVLNLITGL